MRVLAAMSGGVDSSMAAALAVEAGHEVVGVHLKLASSLQSWQDSQGVQRGCGSPKDTEDAAKIAQMLGIPYEVWDLAEEFEEKIVADFVAQYQAGNTPNPCVRCNDLVKTRELLLRSAELGFDAVCTGHYAKLVRVGDQVQLHRAANQAKDQSYVLSVIGQRDLRRLMFPLGDAPSKQWVREQAKKRGFPVSQKPDSFDICFIPDGDTQGFLRSKLGAQPGTIVDSEGEVLGEHSGYYQFTVGQRKGLHLGRPAPSGKPRYVLEINPVNNQVVVGEAELLSVNVIRAGRPVWLTDPQTLTVDEGALAEFGDQVTGSVLEVPETVITAQVRAHGTPSVVRRLEIVETESAEDAETTEAAESTVAAGKAAKGAAAAESGAVRPSGDPGLELRVELAAPIRGVAVGQSLVLYRGTQVVAEAVIRGSSATSRADESVLVGVIG